ncbi:MAG: Purine efflux pump PbuE [Turneriella sp.]|nr:Purine efflux pump PbuE [Turneriella sp.]
MDASALRAKPTFTGYEKFVIAILTFLQFTVILDFMILSPLGAFLIPKLKITPEQFGWVVSAYALSAGISGITAAGFADKFDRKKMLLFFYTGFTLGTLFCGLAPNYHTLLGARIFTGIFGGVMNSIAFAIITDLFPMQVRGRVMGFVQMAFASSQVFGIPMGLYFANHFGWHSSFLMIVTVALPVGFIILFKMRPIDAHLKIKSERNPIAHLIATATKPRYLRGFAATMLLATGGFMLMPFGTVFLNGNLKIDTTDLPVIYTITGIAALFAGPLAGRIADRFGKYQVFTVASLLGITVVLYYTQLQTATLTLITAISAVLFVFITARIVGATTLISGVPAAQDRGAYMGVSSAVQQISGGIASAVAGVIVFQRTDGSLGNYAILGYVVAGTMVITILLMYVIHRMVVVQVASAQSSPSLGQ